MNNFSGTLIDGLQTLRESRIENRESKDGRHNKDSTRAGCRLFTNECRQWSRQSTIEQIRFWPGAFSFTVFHANKTSEDIFNKLQSKNTKAFIMFSCQMHGLASCGDWVIAEKTTPSRQYQKHLSSTVQNMQLVFFSVDVPCTLWAEKRPRAAVKITQRCFTAHFKSRK